MNTFAESESLTQTIDEVHIDFLLEEEFSVDVNFLRKFVETAARNAEPSKLSETLKASSQYDTELRFVSVRHSVSDVHGEADIIVLYELNDTKIAILIEDKINAPFQPRQAERYQARGRLGIQHEWDQYWTCLVASKNYIKSGHGFDTTVELEQIKELIVSTDQGRAQYKSYVIEKAIAKSTAIGPQVVSKTMSDFRIAHYKFFKEVLGREPHGFTLKEPKPVYEGESWFRIGNIHLPRGAYIHHKADRGFVDLTFPETTASRLTGIESILEPDMYTEQTGKSAAIRLLVRSIENFGSFDQEKAKVEEAFCAVARLLNFYVREQARLDPVLNGARTMSENAEPHAVGAFVLGKRGAKNPD